VTWTLGPGKSYTAQTLPYPSINLSVTNTKSDVTGIIRRCYYRQLEGSGYAAGARFRPRCFRALVDWPVSTLTNRHRPIAEVLGRSTRTWNGGSPVCLRVLPVSPPWRLS
jgi:hypothetical protein